MKIQYGELTNGVRACSPERMIKIMKQYFPLFDGEKIVGFEVREDGYIQFHTKLS